MAGPYGDRPVIVERFPASAGVRHVKGGVLYGTLPCFGASVRGGRVHCGRVDKRMVIAVVMAFLGLGVRTAVAQTGGTDLVNETFAGSAVLDPNFRVQGATCLTGRVVGSPLPPGAANIPDCSMTCSCVAVNTTRSNVRVATSVYGFIGTFRTIVRVVDGDTIDRDHGERVRLIGVIVRKVSGRRHGSKRRYG